MTRILAIDSSTEACSVALEDNGRVISRFQIAPRKHAELLLPLVDEVLKESQLSLTDLDAIACCVGPGAFTGLRIAISVAQGLAYASELPCIGVSSLQILAAEVFLKTEATICLTSIDARMQEVYFSVLSKDENGLPKEIHSKQVIAADKIVLTNDIQQILLNSKHKIAKVGTGWSEYQYADVIRDIDCINLFDLDDLSISKDKDKDKKIVFPNAAMMLGIAKEKFNRGELLKPELLQPVYLRNNVAKKKSEQK